MAAAAADFSLIYQYKDVLKSHAGSKSVHNTEGKIPAIFQEHVEQPHRNRSERIYKSDLMESIDDIHSKIKCFVCRRMYRHPRILPCLHTFCSACILNLQTYPCNKVSVGSSVSSQDCSLTSDPFNSEGSEERGRHLQAEQGNESIGRRRRERSLSRKRGLSEERNVFPKGKSQHAKFIEKRLARSSSCGDSFYERVQNSWPDSSISTFSTSLKRRSIISDDQSRRARRKAVVSSVSFNAFNDSVSPRGKDMDIANNKARVVLCPKCLREVDISATLEELPRNFMLERLVGRHLLIQMGQDVQCESSSHLETLSRMEKEPNLRFSYGDQKYDVTAFCVDCQKGLCAPCESSHRESQSKKWHQLIVLEPNSSQAVNGNSSQSNSTGSSEYHSIGDSMSTIPESIRDNSETVPSPTVGKTGSKGPNLIDSVKKLKLPNLHKFSKLFNWKIKLRQVTQDASGVEDAEKVTPEETSNTSKMNGLLNNGFENRRFVEAADLDALAFSEPMKMGNYQTETAGLQQDSGILSKGNLYLETNRKASKLDGRHIKVQTNHVIPCWQHPDEALKMFCVTCELCVCRTCVLLQHSDHDWQILTRQLFQSQMDEVDDLIQQVLPSVQRVDEQLISMEGVKAKIIERSMEVRSQIQNFMDSYVAAIERQRELLLEQVMSLACAHECQLNVTRTHLEDMRSDVEQTCRFVAELLIGSSDLEILSMKKLIKQRLQGFRGHVKRRAYQADTFIRFCPTAQGQVIHNFQMYGKVVDNAPSAARSILLTKGLAETKVSEKCRVALNVCDSGGNSYTGSDVNIRAWVVADGGKGSVSVMIQESSSDGTYPMTFTPNARGTHFLHVTVNGSSVMNSPCKFTVSQKRRRHQGAWQCCVLCHTSGRCDVSCGCGFSHTDAGFLGCVHGTSGHPGTYHWSCCGKTVKASYCDGQTARGARRKVTL